MGATDVTWLIDLPADVAAAVEAKCEALGVSRRALMLFLLTNWSDTSDYAATDRAAAALFDESLATQRRRDTTNAS